MRTNPILDSLKYIFYLNGWTTVAFDLLLLAGVIIAVQALRRFPQQRSGYHVWFCVARIVVGAMWWQQTLWKQPPGYGGLLFWMQEMVKYASIGLQRQFISGVVLPNFNLFAPQVYLSEVIISVSLLLGLWTRLGALIGSAMALNLLFGLYRSPSEWPWTYVFLALLMVQFLVLPPGRSMGLDAFLWKRTGSGSSSGWLKWLR